MPGICSQSSLGLESILSNILNFPKSVLNPHILKLQEDLNVHAIFVIYLIVTDTPQKQNKTKHVNTLYPSKNFSLSQTTCNSIVVEANHFLQNQLT